MGSCFLGDKLQYYFQYSCYWVSLSNKNHTIFSHLWILITVVTLHNSYSETMSVQTFHYIQTQLENCYDMLSSDKKKMLLWSRRMHLALRAYKVKMCVIREGEHNVNRIFRQYNNNLFSVYSTYTSSFLYQVLPGYVCLEE